MSEIGGRWLADTATRHSTTGVVIVGSGAAGLAAAVHLAAARVPTVLITRAAITDSATDWAQGGLAAVWADDDSPALHVGDTLAAGAGLCERAAVTDLVEQAPVAIRRLIDLGARFDRGVDDYDLHLEGGHRRRRILHAGDHSGAEVISTLTGALRRALSEPGATITVLEHHRALDVLTGADGAARGVRLLAADGTVEDLAARAVVLATGGVGQLWRGTSNPSVATGDGVAMAWRAGATIRDLEFVQFHPTVLAVPGGRGVLISEAVRGEGAVLIDHTGARVMDGRHPLADLAPRDVVAATMQEHLMRTGEPHLFLDGTALGPETWHGHFPTILQMCRKRGVDPVTEPIPVLPGAHYVCGGIAADLSGRTSVPGLFAVGEVAATGVHGANRLASNSVPEALVAGDRVGAVLAARTPRHDIAGTTRPADRPPPDHLTVAPIDPEGIDAPRGAMGTGAEVVRTAENMTAALIDPAGIDPLRGTMSTGTGVVRTADSLTTAADRLAALPTTSVLDEATVDATNLHTVATLLVAAALARTESRGAHRRLDHPDTSDSWQRHITLERSADGRLVVGTQPLDAASSAIDATAVVPTHTTASAVRSHSNNSDRTPQTSDVPSRSTPTDAPTETEAA